jgi:hypothetical protein
MRDKKKKRERKSIEELTKGIEEHHAQILPDSDLILHAYSLVS